MEKTIYMPLVGEGTDCWRPVRAVQIDGDTFEVVDDIDGIPENESWAFTPFSRVRCRNKVFADGQAGLVVSAYAIESHPYYLLLQDHEGKVFRIVLADVEEAVVRISYVDGEHEDVLSTNLERKYRLMPREAAYAVKFADLVSARLEG